METAIKPTTRRAWIPGPRDPAPIPNAAVPERRRDAEQADSLPSDSAKLRAIRKARQLKPNASITALQDESGCRLLLSRLGRSIAVTANTWTHMVDRIGEERDRLRWL